MFWNRLSVIFNHICFSLVKRKIFYLILTNTSSVIRRRCLYVRWRELHNIQNRMIMQQCLKTQLYLLLKTSTMDKSLSVRNMPSKVLFPVSLRWTPLVSASSLPFAIKAAFYFKISLQIHLIVVRNQIMVKTYIFSPFCFENRQFPFLPSGYSYYT